MMLTPHDVTDDIIMRSSAPLAELDHEGWERTSSSNSRAVYVVFIAIAIRHSAVFHVICVAAAIHHHSAYSYVTPAPYVIRDSVVVQLTPLTGLPVTTRTTYV